MVKSDLALLELLLSRIESMFVQGLDCVKQMGMDVDCGVHNSIGANTKNAGKLKPVGNQ